MRDSSRLANERAEVLLHEVNHRVANSFAIVGSMNFVNSLSATAAASPSEQSRDIADFWRKTCSHAYQTSKESLTEQPGGAGYSIEAPRLAAITLTILPPTPVPRG